MTSHSDTVVAIVTDKSVAVSPPIDGDQSSCDKFRDKSAKDSVIAQLLLTSRRPLFKLHSQKITWKSTTIGDVTPDSGHPSVDNSDAHGDKYRVGLALTQLSPSQTVIDMSARKLSPDSQPSLTSLLNGEEHHSMTPSDYHRDVQKHVTVYEPGFTKDRSPSNGCLDSATMTSASLRTLLQVQRRDVVSVSGCIRREVEIERKEQCLMSVNGSKDTDSDVNTSSLNGTVYFNGNKPNGIGYKTNLRSPQNDLDGVEVIGEDCSTFSRQRLTQRRSTSMTSNRPAESAQEVNGSGPWTQLLTAKPPVNGRVTAPAGLGNPFSPVTEDDQRNNRGSLLSAREFSSDNAHVTSGDVIWGTRNGEESQRCYLPIFNRKISHATCRLSDSTGVPTGNSPTGNSVLRRSMCVSSAEHREAVNESSVQITRSPRPLVHVVMTANGHSGNDTCYNDSVPSRHLQEHPEIKATLEKYLPASENNNIRDLSIIIRDESPPSKRNSDVIGMSSMELARSRLPRKRFRYDTSLSDDMFTWDVKSKAEDSTIAEAANICRPIPIRMKPVDVIEKCEWKPEVMADYGERRDVGSQCDSVFVDCAQGRSRSPPGVVSCRSGDVGSWCRPCGIWFSDEVLFSIHAGCHSSVSAGGDLFSCNVCGRQCSDRYAFNTHLVRGHDRLGTQLPQLRVGSQSQASERQLFVANHHSQLTLNTSLPGELIQRTISGYESMTSSRDATG